MVEQHLYRSAHPAPRNFPFLKQLELRSIISITDELDPALEQFAEEADIQILHIKVKRAFNNITLDHGHVAAFLNGVVDPTNQPCLVMCYDGSESSGLSIMCLRKLQMYSLQFAISEFVRHRIAAADPFGSDELRLVETFKSPVQIPAEIPQWLWKGDVSFKHPTIRVRSSDIFLSRLGELLPAVSRPSRYFLAFEGDHASDLPRKDCAASADHDATLSSPFSPSLEALALEVPAAVDNN